MPGERLPLFQGIAHAREGPVPKAIYFAPALKPLRVILRSSGCLYRSGMPERSRPEGADSNVRAWANPRPGADPAQDYGGRLPSFSPCLAVPSSLSPHTVAMTSRHIRSIGLVSRLEDE